MDGIKYINLLFLETDGTLKCCYSIDNNEYELKNIHELKCKLEKKIRDEFYITDIKLEQSYLGSLIALYSKEQNKGYINWKYKYEDLSFEKMNELLPYKPIIIEIYICPDGVGGTSGAICNFLDIILTLKDFFQNIRKKFPSLGQSYKFFKEKYDIEKSLIQKVIAEEFAWRQGFIDEGMYEEKYIFEKKIMKSLGYKYSKKEKKWLINI